MDYFVYLIYRLFTTLVAALPLPVAFAFGKMFGAVCYFIVPPYRRLVIRNLTIAFGGEKTAREIRALGLRHFSTLGANLLSSVKLATMSREKIMACVTIENYEWVKSALKTGRGIVLVISHIGNWEVFGQVMPLIVEPGCKAGTIYQRLRNRYIDAHVRAARARLGLYLFERKEGINAAVDVLREQGGVGVLVDQHAGDAGVWTPLFGRLASTSSLAPMLALRANAALIPAAVYTSGFAKWRMVFSPEIESVGRDANPLTAEINQALERQIRVSPQDWFWVHNRWKTPNPYFLLAKYKRGIHFPENVTPSQLKPFRILIRSSNWLGDAVMTVPAVRAIKQGRPDAHVTILTRDKLVDFWRLVPEVDDVISIGKSDSIFRVAKKISTGFEVAVLFPNSVRAALEVRLAGIPRRVGCAGKWRRKLLNQIVPAEKKSHPIEHQAHHYLRIAKYTGADGDSLQAAIAGFSQFRTPHSAFRNSARLGLCPGAEYGPAKRFFTERYAEVMREVSLRCSCEWVLFGTAKDQSIGEQIAGPSGSNSETSVRCTNLIGKTSLSELIAELSRCDLLLTNDTGTMHLAAFLGVPTVSVFGSTEPALTGPLGTGHTVLRHHVPCSPCFLRECPIDFRCMKSIGTDEVVAAVLEKLV